MSVGANVRKMRLERNMTLPSRFYINTVLAKESKVGDRRSITLSEVMELAKELADFFGCKTDDFLKDI